MPLAPRAQTHPQPAGEGRGEGSRAWRAGGPGPVSLPRDPEWGDGLTPGSSSRGSARQGATVAREGGVRPQWPRTSRSGNPLPHSLSLQLCRGLTNGKRKLGQRKRRQTPRLKNPDKRRGPPAPAARPPGSWHCLRGRCPLLWQPRASWPPVYLLPSRPGQLSVRLPPRPATSRGSSQPCPRCPRCAPLAVPAERGRRDPGPAANSREGPRSAPSPGPIPHLGRPGLRAGRDPDQAEGDSIHRATAAALRPGHYSRTGQEPGRGGAGGQALPPLAPPLELRRGAPAASPQGSKLPKATEVGFCADIGPRSQNTALREVVSGRQSGPASRELAFRGPAQRDGDLGWLKREDEGTELRNTRRGRVGVRQEGEGKQRETQANRDVRNRATEGMREAETR